MNNATDKFFEEMLNAAKSKAKQEIKQETRDKLAVVAQLKKDLATAKKEIKELRKSENAITKRWEEIQRQEEALSYREEQVKLAEKEIVYIADKIEAIKQEKVETRVTTKTVRSIATGSRRKGYGWRTYPTPKAAALSAIKRRVTKAKKESKA